MLRFRDFVPEELTKGGLFVGPKFEGLQDAVDTANAWIESSRIAVVSVETLLLPNIREPWEEGSTDISLGTSASSYWYQVIRIWYRD